MERIGIGNGEVYGKFISTVAIYVFDFVVQFCIFVSLL